MKSTDKQTIKYPWLHLPTLILLTALSAGLSSYAIENPTNITTSTPSNHELVKLKYKFGLQSQSGWNVQKGTLSLSYGEEIRTKLGDIEFTMKYSKSSDTGMSIMSVGFVTQSNNKVLDEFTTPFDGVLERSIEFKDSDIKKVFIKIKSQ